MPDFPVVSLLLLLWVGKVVCLNQPSDYGGISNSTDDLSTVGTIAGQLTKTNTSGVHSLRPTDQASSIQGTNPPSESPQFLPTTSTAFSSNETSTAMAMADTTDLAVGRRSICFPGFECIHGYCLTEFSCECQEGWTGLFCQSPCPVCGQDAVCGVNPSGDPACLCPDRRARYDPKHGCSKDSDPTTSQLPTTTGDLLRPVSERECFPGFRCVHGYCQVGLLGCICDQGWVGQFCHEACTLDCQGRGVCLLTQAAVQYCDCFEEFSGQNCESRRITESPGTESTNRSKTTPPSDTKTTSRMTSSTPSTKGKECAPGFPCVHGVCVPDVIKCQCDPGWQGLFCHKPAIERATLPESADTTGVSNMTSLDLLTIQHTDWTSLKGYGKLSAFSLRNCSLGFTCRYGNCSAGPGIGCDCESGFTGTFCQDPCALDCGENGACRVNPDNQTDMFCECSYPFTGLNCSLVRRNKQEEEEESSSHWYAIGVAVAIFLIMTLGLVVLPYLLWRRRNITVMKIVFWLRNYEDHDGREFDAFVAYASTESDRQFVLHELIPNLEQRLSFSLCIHERDFLPGNYIAANINEAISKSRRTLIIVSPTFVSRKWCQFEFEVAVREMVEHKHRILPIILGDISEVKEQMSDSLRHILSTVTYIEYPGTDASQQDMKKFWKKLELSMPKKQSKPPSDYLGTSSSSSSSSSSTSFQSSSSSPSMCFPCSSSPPMSSDSEVNSQTDDMHISPSTCQPSSLSPIEKSGSSGRQFRRFVQVPISHVDGDKPKPVEGKLFSRLWSRFKRQKVRANQRSSREDDTKEKSPPPQRLPKSFGHAKHGLGTNLACLSFSPAESTGQVQELAKQWKLEETSKSSPTKSGMDKKYVHLENDVSSSIEKTPVCHIAQNFLGNQSLLFSHTQDNLSYVSFE